MAPEITPGGRRMRAVWRGAVLADSEDTLVTEGNHYFPPQSVRTALLSPSDEHTVCPWKGTASYYDVTVGDDVAHGAAWFYPETKPDAEPLRERVAFWRGVQVLSAS
jgi:uncharacterized protein (DUF427 family)